MKYVIMSDVHTEFEKNRRNFLAEFDQRYGEGQGKDKTCILPGDIGNLSTPVLVSELYELLTHISSKFLATYFVPGNHCFYRTSISAGSRILDSFEIPGFKLLTPGKICETPDGRAISGSTGWFPPGAMRWVKRQLNDFRVITDFELEVYDQFNKFNDLVEKFIPQGSIVVSHHAPTSLSVAPRFQNEDTNWFFMYDRSKAILDKAPSLWCHGHTHDFFDYMVDKTRVYCDPKGYEFEGANKEFWDRCEIEL